MPTSPAAPARALVAAEDPASRHVLAQTLRQAGLSVAEAGSGPEALARAPGHDLLVFALPLSGLNGPEVCGHLRADPAAAAVPLLLVSADFAQSERRAEALEQGAD